MASGSATTSRRLTIDCSVAGSGGGICMDSKHSFNMSGILLKSNAAQNGGGLLYKGSCRDSMRNGGAGGACNLLLAGDLLSGNKVVGAGGGGAVYAADTKVLAQNTCRQISSGDRAASDLAAPLCGATETAVWRSNQAVGPAAYGSLVAGPPMHVSSNLTSAPQQLESGDLMYISAQMKVSASLEMQFKAMHAFC